MSRIMLVVLLLHSKTASSKCFFIREMKGKITIAMKKSENHHRLLTTQLLSELTGAWTLVWLAGRYEQKRTWRTEPAGSLSWSVLANFVSLFFFGQLELKAFSECVCVCVWLDGGGGLLDPRTTTILGRLRALDKKWLLLYHIWERYRKAAKPHILPSGEA